MRMLPILLIITGLLITSLGLYLWYKQYSANGQNQTLKTAIATAVADGVLTENEKASITKIAGANAKEVLAEAQAQIDEGTIEPETKARNLNKEKGDAFEKYVYSRFNAKMVSLVAWAGDKYMDGVYDKNTQQPDLQLALEYKGKSYPFAIECKWRSTFKKGAIMWAKPEQIARYQNFEAETQQPTFVAIGVGGKAQQPENLFILPLKALKYPLAKAEYLERYKVSLKGTLSFYFENKVIK
jgi:hypothetical protein